MERVAHAPLTRHTAALAVALLVAAFMAGACASTPGASPRPFPLPRGPEGPPAAMSPELSPEDAAAARHPSGLLQTALDLRGVKYRWGGSDLNGFDCSGFTQYVFSRHGVYLPREVRDQFRQGLRVERQDVQAGDLLFFTIKEPGASHVAIALGGDEFVHAPSSAGVVRIERLSSGYWSRRFVGARRVRLEELLPSEN